MSGLDESGGEDPLQHDSDELTRLFEQVRVAAKRMARRNKIADYEEDLVQAVVLELLTEQQASGRPIGEEEIERVMKKLAAKEVYRRRTENSGRVRLTKALRDHAARNPREIHRAPINLPPVKAPKQKGIPTLCLRFVLLAAGTGHEADMDLGVLAAATDAAHDLKVLRAEQHHAFSLAYVHEWSRDTIAPLLGTTPRRCHAAASTNCAETRICPDRECGARS